MTKAHTLLNKIVPSTPPPLAAWSIALAIAPAIRPKSIPARIFMAWFLDAFLVDPYKLSIPTHLAHRPSEITCALVNNAGEIGSCEGGKNQSLEGCSVSLATTLPLR
jgi:hypothetical protein